MATQNVMVYNNQWTFIANPGIAGLLSHSLGGKMLFCIADSLPAASVFYGHPLNPGDTKEIDLVGLSGGLFVRMNRGEVAETGVISFTASSFSIGAGIENKQADLGNKFEIAKNFSNVDIATPLYILFENPSDSKVGIGLVKRQLKTSDSGLSSFQILWDYDVSTSTKTTLTKFNSNDYFRTTKPGKAEISVLNPITIQSNGYLQLGGAAVGPVSQGIEREGDFIAASGIGANTSGGVSPDIGVRIYMPGEGFLTKMVSDGDDNIINWGYAYYEIPIELGAFA